MSDTATRPLSDARIQTLIGWTVTGIGMLTFHLLHIYAAVGALAAQGADAGHDHAHAHAHGHDHAHGHEHAAGHLDSFALMADPQSSMNWMMMVYLVLAVVPATIGLFSAKRIAAIGSLVVGAIYSVMMSLDGFSHGFGEGAWATLVLVLVAVLLPAVAATIRNIQWIKAAGAATRD